MRGIQYAAASPRMHGQLWNTGSPGHPRSGRVQAPDADRGSGCLKSESENWVFLPQVAGRAPMTLAVLRYRCYIAKARLRRASGAIYPRGLIDPLGNCPWPGPWIRTYGAHLLS